MLCERLGCTYTGTLRFRYIEPHFDAEDGIREERICTVCRDEHEETLRACGYVLVCVKKVPTTMAA